MQLTAVERLTLGVDMDKIVNKLSPNELRLIVKQVMEAYIRGEIKIDIPALRLIKE